MTEARTHLPLDYCRCLGIHCERFWDCARYRDKPSDQPLWLNMTMCELDGEKAYDHFIPYKEPTDD